MLISEARRARGGEWCNRENNGVACWRYTNEYKYTHSVLQRGEEKREIIIIIVIKATSATELYENSTGRYTVLVKK